MGKPTGVANDYAQQVQTGTRSTPGVVRLGDFSGRWNLTISGTFTGTCQLERTFDEGSNVWYPCTDMGAVRQWSAPMSEVIDSPERGVIYQLNIITLSAGSVTVRASK